MTMKRINFKIAELLTTILTTKKDAERWPSAAARDQHPS